MKVMPHCGILLFLNDQIIVGFGIHLSILVLFLTPKTRIEIWKTFYNLASLTASRLHIKIYMTGWEKDGDLNLSIFYMFLTSKLRSFKEKIMFIGLFDMKRQKNKGWRKTTRRKAMKNNTTCAICQNFPYIVIDPIDFRWYHMSRCSLVYIIVYNFDD